MLILSWLLVSQFEAQRALQWWYGRQSSQLCHQAEGIRNGLLQESFTVRRNLELALLEDGERSEQPQQEWLVKIDRLHHALRKLSDQLSPPYLDDSLPLAIQSVLESWKSRSLRYRFGWELPAEWRPESHERSRVVLMALDELLRLTFLDGSGGAVAVQLHQRGDLGELSVQFSDLDRPTPPRSVAKELAYLKRAFRFLTFGECFCRHIDQTVVWYFRWRPPSNRNGL